MTVGVIALPLAIGFGIASGVTPAQGIWTAILAGLLVALFGGSKVQIAGPTGAFVPILSGIVAQHGYEGLAVATLMAGLFLAGMGVLRLGNLIKFIPYPVIAGFTTGIAVIIFIGQLKELLGLKITLPQHALPQAGAIFQHVSESSPGALSLCALSFAILLLWPKRWAKIPPSIVAIILPAIAVAAMGLDDPARWPHFAVATIGTKYGGIPSSFPGFHFQLVSFTQLQSLILPALTIAMLGAIESLLSAMVADGMIEARHDSNQELIGQGIANVLVPLFGGISATGAIARTATNVRSGGRTPVAGIIHSATLLLIVWFAGHWARYIPLASLSAVLCLVAYRMGEWHNFVELKRGPRSDFIVLVLTCVMTVVFDLTVAVGVGLLMAAALFVRRMEEITHVRLTTPENEFDPSGQTLAGKPMPPGVLAFRIEGPFFFGAAEKLEAAISRFDPMPRMVILRMRNVPAMDATGLRAMRIILNRFRRRNVQLLLSGVQAQPMKVFYTTGFADDLGLDNFCANIESAVARAWNLLE